MKSEGAIRHKLKQVRFRHLKKHVERELKPHPDNCTHNRPLKQPVGGVLRICVHPDQEGGQRLCDEEWEGEEKAKLCRLFTCCSTKDEVKETFKEELAGMSFAQIAYIYPDMAALMWTLDEETVDEDWEGKPDSETEHISYVHINGRKVREDSPEAITAFRMIREELAEMKEAAPTEPPAETREEPVPAKVGAIQKQQAELAASKKTWWQRLWGRIFG